MGPLVNEPEPFARITWPGRRPDWTSTGPFTPAAPGWMCSALIGVFGGNPDRFTTKVTVAAVTLPAAKVSSNVAVTLPVPTDSAFPIAGTSLAGDNVAVYTAWDADGAVVPELVQAAAKKLSATAKTDKRFIGDLL
jgi:hypothetical protein